MLADMSVTVPLLPSRDDLLALFRAALANAHDLRQRYTKAPGQAFG